MSHFTVLIPAKDENDLREKLLPYHEYGWGDGEADDEIVKKGYVEFKDVYEEHKHEYESDGTERIVMPDGRLLAPWDDEFKVRDPSSPFQNTTKSEPPAHLERRQVPFKEMFATYEDYIEEWHGYHKDKNTDKYGYWHNPRAKWDWYQPGGRWTGTLKLKRNGVTLPAPEEILQGDMQIINKMAYLKRNDPDGYIKMISEMKAKYEPDQVDAVDRYIEAIMQTYKLEGSGHGHPGLMTKPSFEIDTADYAPAGNVDWDGMKADQINNARKRWQTAERVFKAAGEDISKWAQLKMDEQWEEANAIMRLVQDHFNGKQDKDIRDNIIDTMFFEPNGASEEEHVNAERYQSLTYAFIDMEGQWNEKGEMGWFGVQLNHDSDYHRAFWDFIETIPPEQIVYVVDCHI